MTSKLHVLTLEHRRLTADALAQLQAARIVTEPGKSPSEAFRAGVPYPIADAAVIEKCNAVIVVAFVEVDADEDFVRDRLISVWLDLAPGMAAHTGKIAHYAGRRAIEHLGEVSVGLHSVVLGDSQVFAQVCAGLGAARDAGLQSSPFAIMIRSLRTLLRSVSANTALQQGNVSLERVACERLVAELGQRPASVAVIGLGRAGRLVADILAKETAYDLVVTNRSAQAAAALRHPRVRTAPWGELSFLNEADAVVFCLASNAETDAFALRTLAHLTPAETHPRVVIDLTSPSVTRDAPAGVPATLVRIEQLSEDSAKNLSSRKQSVNKAKQIVAEWADELDARFADDAAQRWPHSRSVLPNAAPPGVGGHRSAMLSTIRDHLAAAGFQEIQTPRAPAPGVGRGGSPRPDGRWTDDAELRTLTRQVGQLVALADLPMVYEIGPSWQSAVQPTPADLFESYTLDVALRTTADMAELYTLALDLVAAVAKRVRPPDDGAALHVPAAGDVPVLAYDEAVDLLAEVGYAIRYGTDLGFDLNYFLADLVRRRHGADVLVVHGFPDMTGRVHPARRADGASTHTFTIVLDGWQIAEGALRETDPSVVRRRLDLSGVHSDRYRRHLEVLSGAPPHGGFELGLDRLLARVLRLDTARQVAPLAVV